MRKTRTWVNNAYRAGEGAYNRGATLASNHRGVMYVTDGHVQTEWYHRFEEGYKRRMGIIRKQNEALVVGQLLVVIEVAEEDYQKATSDGEKRVIVTLIAFVIIGFMISLRGEEVPFLYWQCRRHVADMSARHDMSPRLAPTGWLSATFRRMSRVGCGRVSFLPKAWRRKRALRFLLGAMDGGSDGDEPRPIKRRSGTGTHARVAGREENASRGRRRPTRSRSPPAPGSLPSDPSSRR
ncbi:hypothetical protein THAOC_10299 [Thalassiosira oceanica]|uniref:Uncharacterized protein n=1 Tax=Thalassiosira oceanica TaxID=159749 RepID=K0T5A2_THAOC|nr:hypothetical protein THAOC_10299 [Thalassiosira oceanica]|eukprot:EJK68511.1 hypothetical protein THAOC_10299 [Thalassiosira oceanica]